MSRYAFLLTIDRECGYGTRDLVCGSDDQLVILPLFNSDIEISRCKRIAGC